MSSRSPGPVGRAHRSPVSLLLATNGRTLGAMFLAGALAGTGALAIPHGRHFNSLADVAISGLAAAVGLWAWRRVRLGPWALSGLLCVGTLAVSAGVYSGRGDLVSVSAAVIYVWLALVAGLFLSSRRAAAHLGLIALSYAAVLVLTGNSGAPAEWLFVTGTAAVTAVVTLAIRHDFVRVSERDPLTGLPNRAGLDRVLEREMARARRDGATLSLGVVDLDGFKALNDEAGHLAGDEALVTTVRSWQEALRGSDVLARFGGDEFVVVLPGASLLQAGRVLHRMRRGEAAWQCSAGLAAWDGAETAGRLIARADAALYEAKARRRNRTVVLARQDGARRAGGATGRAAAS